MESRRGRRRNQSSAIQTPLEAFSSTSSESEERDGSGSPKDRQHLLEKMMDLSCKMYFGSTDPFVEILRDKQLPEPPQYSLLDIMVSDGVYKGLSKKDQTKPVLLNPLDVLTAKVRIPEVIDFWSPYEVAIFEWFLCKFGENSLDEIAKQIPTKTCEDVKQFYAEIYSKTSRIQYTQLIRAKYMFVVFIALLGKVIYANSGCSVVDVEKWSYSSDMGETFSRLLEDARSQNFVLFVEGQHQSAKLGILRKLESVGLSKDCAECMSLYGRCVSMRCHQLCPVHDSFTPFCHECIKQTCMAPLSMCAKVPVSALPPLPTSNEL